jgi:hypothetical protein
MRPNQFLQLDESFSVLPGRNIGCYPMAGCGVILAGGVKVYTKDRAD